MNQNIRGRQKLEGETYEEYSARRFDELKLEFHASTATSPTGFLIKKVIFLEWYILEMYEEQERTYR